ncbi:MAG: hypothetical protein ACYC0C_17175 [Devosia sp.]
MPTVSQNCAAEANFPGNRLGVRGAFQSVLSHGHSAAWAIALALTPVFAVPALAEIALSCPDASGEKGTSLLFANGTLSFSEEGRTMALNGTIQNGLAGEFSITASGEMDALMPRLESLDACIATKLQAKATDGDALAYVLNSCRLRLASEAIRQKISATFTIASVEPGLAVIFRQRRYLHASSVTGEPVQINEFPPWNCDVKVAS